MKHNGCKYLSEQGLCAVALGKGMNRQASVCLYIDVTEQRKPWCYTKSRVTVIHLTAHDMYFSDCQKRYLYEQLRDAIGDGDE